MCDDGWSQVSSLILPSPHSTLCWLLIPFLVRPSLVTWQPGWPCRHAPAAKTGDTSWSRSLLREGCGLDKAQFKTCVIHALHLLQRYFLNSALIYSFIFFHFLVFEFRFDFVLINQTHTWLCTFTSTSVSGKLLYVAPSCYLKCPCHPMSIPQSCISKIFFRDIWLKLWLYFRRSSSHSSAAKGRQAKWNWVWRLQLYLSQRLCLYAQETFQNLSFAPWRGFTMKMVSKD